MVTIKRLLSFSLVLIGLTAFSQENLQSYTPSILFDRGEWEFKSFQNVYWQTKSFTKAGIKTADNGGGRQLWATSINQFLYGINSQINVGIDVWVKHVNYELGNLDTRTAVTGIGPKVKIAPFKGLKRLSIQSSVLFPGVKDMESSKDDSSPFLETDKTLWLTQFFYDKQINDQWQVFFQQAFWANFVRNSFAENSFLQTQTSVFLSYFPNQRWTFYTMSEFFPTHYDSSAEQTAKAFNAYFVQSGLGAKFQLVPNMVELELLYTDFWLGSSGQGAGQTLNLGLRIINQ
ncbi:MAG: hypothetical protein JXR03_01130 [Cyclobacteriaceae bacterium]